MAAGQYIYELICSTYAPVISWSFCHGALGTRSPATNSDRVTEPMTTVGLLQRVDMYHAGTFSGFSYISAKQLTTAWAKTASVFVRCRERV